MFIHKLLIPHSFLLSVEPHCLSSLLASDRPLTHLLAFQHHHATSLTRTLSSEPVISKPRLFCLQDVTAPMSCIQPNSLDWATGPHIASHWCKFNNSNIIINNNNVYYATQIRTSHKRTVRLQHQTEMFQSIPAGSQRRHYTASINRTTTTFCSYKLSYLFVNVINITGTK